MTLLSCLVIYCKLVMILPLLFDVLCCYRHIASLSPASLDNAADCCDVTCNYATILFSLVTAMRSIHARAIIGRKRGQGGKLTKWLGAEM